jgi:hypothetical protein
LYSWKSQWCRHTCAGAEEATNEKLVNC